MAIFARIILINKHELKPTLTITGKNGLWWSNSPYLKYRKVFFPCPNFIIHNMVTAFGHSRILSSAFCHTCFIIRILSSAFYHPHFIIRHPPPSGLRFTGTFSLNVQTAKQSYFLRTRATVNIRKVWSKCNNGEGVRKRLFCSLLNVRIKILKK